MLDSLRNLFISYLRMAKVARKNEVGEKKAGLGFINSTCLGKEIRLHQVGVIGYAQESKDNLYFRAEFL